MTIKTRRNSPFILVDCEWSDARAMHAVKEFNARKLPLLPTDPQIRDYLARVPRPRGRAQVWPKYIVSGGTRSYIQFTAVPFQLFTGRWVLAIQSEVIVYLSVFTSAAMVLEAFKDLGIEPA